jgi:chromate transporter
VQNSVFRTSNKNVQPGSLCPGSPRFCATFPLEIVNIKILKIFNMDKPLAVPDRPGPRDLRDLFFSFTLLALQGFGGVMVIVYRELVEKKGWLSDDEFLEDWSVAQILPGANIINMSLIIGNRYFGVRGALTALSGLMLAPLVIVIAATLIYSKYADYPGVIGALRGMGAVVAGLIGATGLRLMKSLRASPLQKPVCIAILSCCFLMIAIMRWPLGYALLGLGLISCVLTYRRIQA